MTRRKLGLQRDAAAVPLNGSLVTTLADDEGEGRRLKSGEGVWGEVMMACGWSGRRRPRGLISTPRARTRQVTCDRLQQRRQATRLAVCSQLQTQHHAASRPPLARTRLSASIRVPPPARGTPAQNTPSPRRPLRSPLALARLSDRHHGRAQTRTRDRPML